MLVSSACFVTSNIRLTYFSHFVCLSYTDTTLVIEIKRRAGAQITRVYMKRGRSTSDLGFGSRVKFLLSIFLARFSNRRRDTCDATHDVYVGPDQTSGRWTCDTCRSYVSMNPTVGPESARRITSTIVFDLST